LLAVPNIFSVIFSHYISLVFPTIGAYIMTLHNRICLLVRKLVQNAHFGAYYGHIFFNYVFVVENVIHHWTKFDGSFPKSKFLMCCTWRSSTLIIYVVD